VVNNASAITARHQRANPPQPKREDREIESWLGELRGGGGQQQPAPPPAPPSADPTTAIPVPRTGKPGAAPSPADDTTTAIPVGHAKDPDETEKLKAPEKESRRSGGVSAQELLRREGRL
jgi:RND superfamily putative drug exporter